MTTRLTTLEEDLKELGLLPSTPAAAAPVSESTTASGEPLEEKFRLSFMGRKGVRQKVKRMSGADRAASRRRSRKGSVKAARKKAMKKKMRSSKARRIMAFKRKVSRKMHGESLRTLKTQVLEFIQRARPFMDSSHPASQTEAVAGLTRPTLKGVALSPLAEEIEQIRRLSESAQTQNVAEAMRAFAKLSLFADSLAERLQAAGEIAEAVAFGDELRACAEVAAALAEDASKMASGLNESDATQIDFALLTNAFRGQMSLALEAAEIYDALDEGEEHPDDKSKTDAEMAKADDEGDDDEEEDDEDDEDDEDEDEGEE